jgi:hypothetical protein
MTIQRMENVGIVVEDLAAATSFFVELGLKVLVEVPVEGDWVDRVVGLEGVRVDIAMLETLDGHGRLELMKFHTPTARGGDRHAPANRWEFAVSHLQLMTSTTPSPGCRPVAPSSLVGWSATKTAIGSATSAARRGSSSCWPSRSAEGALQSPTTNPSEEPSVRIVNPQWGARSSSGSAIDATRRYSVVDRNRVAVRILEDERAPKGGVERVDEDRHAPTLQPVVERLSVIGVQRDRHAESARPGVEIGTRQGITNRERNGVRPKRNYPRRRAGFALQSQLLFVEGCRPLEIANLKADEVGA